MKNEKDGSHDTDHKITALINVQLAQTLVLHRSGILPAAAIPAFDDLCAMLVSVPDA
ncbi:MAG: hypothetical protein HQL73_12960 [Magnetococcales bacterium]|nr:hypothetical protein [Magnetococcales bacterium]